MDVVIVFDEPHKHTSTCALVLFFAFGLVQFLGFFFHPVHFILNIKVDEAIFCQTHFWRNICLYKRDEEKPRAYNLPMLLTNVIKYNRRFERVQTSSSEIMQNRHNYTDLKR